MFFRQRSSDALETFLTFFFVPVEIFLEQEIHDYQLGDLRGNGTKLIRAFVRTAAQHHFRQVRSGGFAEAGDQNAADSSGFGQFQNPDTTGSLLPLQY